MITFTPLSGDAQSSDGGPLAYLLQVDDVKVLLDCGSPDWNPESLRTGQPAPWDGYCQSLKAIARDVDLVLLSHGDLQHCGLFPYAFAHWDLRAPAYATYPVQATGRVAVTEEVDTLRSEQALSDSAAPTPQAAEPGNDEQPMDTEESAVTPAQPGSKFIAEKDDVFRAFESIVTMRYSQPSHLQGKCQGLTITPYAAGHTLGGTVWKIRSPSAGTIVYGVNLNHTRERHLDGTILFRGQIFDALARPDLFITDAERTLVVNARRKDRDEALLKIVTETLQSNSLMIPVDSSARLLELLVLFDQHWTFSKQKAPICLVSKTGVEMLTFVRSMMEWFGGHISKEDIGVKDPQPQTGKKRKRDDEDADDGIGAAALRFRHLEFFNSYSALMSTYPSAKPKLILAVPQNLSSGSSRALFADFAAVPANVVVLTNRGEPDTLSRHLFDQWNARQDARDRYGGGVIGKPVQLDESMHILMRAKIPLQGAELEAYLQAERLAKERAAVQQAAITQAQLLIEADDSDSDEDSDEDQDPDGGNPAGTGEPGDVGLRGETNWLFDNADDGTGRGANYDIFIKGGVAKTTSFFKAAEGQVQRFKMFPYIERRRRVDTFGEVVDVAMWQRRSKALPQSAESEEAQEQKRLQLEEEKAKQAAADPPSKFVESEIDVKLACRLFFIDMDGLNDSRAIKTIVPQVAPRKMILVHASSEATNALVDSCAAITAMTREVYTPSQGENLQIGQHVNSFSFSLSDALLASLKMSRFEDTEVGYVHGKLVSHASSSIPSLEPMQALTSGPTADGLAQLPYSTMIGDLKLTSLRTRLAAIGIPAEFAGEGLLVCGDFVRDANADPNGVVAVRKLGRGKVEIDGGVSPTFYAVRQEVYGLHAVVAPV
ncbi:beta-lactamase-like protein [Auriculariales sp. MPI-PUGE-AT-0066]|nr:beta-lactamase-like protein [Auriculariales sp. MPI-PUGE-AT-0066]